MKTSRKNWLTHCHTQFKPFGIRTLCSSCFYISEALTWKIYGNIEIKDLIPERSELGKTMR